MTLKENDFVQSISDYSLFAKSRNGLFLALFIYGDDLVVTMRSKPVGAPLEANISISSTPTNDDPVLNNITEYKKLIGKLIYLTRTRPDISFSVQCLSQFMHSPLQSHLKIALRFLRYLKTSPGKAALHSKSDSIFLAAYVDTDWGKCISSRKFVTGFAVLFCNSLISWKSKNQANVSISSTESEYRAMASGLLPVKLHFDNRSTIQLAANHIRNLQSKKILQRKEEIGEEMTVSRSKAKTVNESNYSRVTRLKSSLNELKTEFERARARASYLEFE
ncbi:uncharacterized mitochondrial protein AtMg00810-like [Rutidosis leptorrhynchoides]|uniref:uncharacterized mitochondrial protein AtMg00810-like n=1 Tax=Rutidosis leptorrhynchoides TaxID=125765 RepID=UPI003A9A3174